jgi:hypothetical protein
LYPKSPNLASEAPSRGHRIRCSARSRGRDVPLLLLLIAWTSDALDGPLARRDPHGTHTWIGDRDLEADMTVALGVWAYLALAGFLHPWLALAYVLGAAVALWRFGSDPVAWGLQALP